MFPQYKHSVVVTLTVSLLFLFAPMTAAGQDAPNCGEGENCAETGSASWTPEWFADNGPGLQITGSYQGYRQVYNGGEPYNRRLEVGYRATSIRLWVRNGSFVQAIGVGGGFPADAPEGFEGVVNATAHVGVEFFSWPQFENMDLSLVNLTIGAQSQYSYTFTDFGGNLKTGLHSLAAGMWLRQAIYWKDLIFAVEYRGSEFGIADFNTTLERTRQLQMLLGYGF